MAKHMVKCSICGQTFDANAEPYVKTHSDRRYAHERCALSQEEQKTQEEKDRYELEEYIKQLLNISCLTPRIRKQIKSFLEEYKYTYSGIRKALVYFYEVKGNPVEKANGGIGIVPFTYNQAYRYYYALWEAQQKNIDKQVQQYQPHVKEVRIASPKRRIRKRSLFAFLDKESE